MKKLKRKFSEYYPLGKTNMDGNIFVTYKILCDTDFNAEIFLSELLANEKIAKIKIECC